MNHKKIDYNSEKKNKKMTPQKQINKKSRNYMSPIYIELLVVADM